MITYVCDTHALLWYLAQPRLLGVQARHAFAEAAAGRARIIVPVIVFAEIIFAVERGRFQADVSRIMELVKSTPCFRIVPLNLAGVCRLQRATAIPEMHDRLIVGEALWRKAALITRDGTIIKTGMVPTIW